MRDGKTIMRYIMVGVQGLKNERSNMVVQNEGYCSQRWLMVDGERDCKQRADGKCA